MTIQPLRVIDVITFAIEKAVTSGRSWRSLPDR